jgi:hypothetical protein
MILLSSEQDFSLQWFTLKVKDLWWASISDASNGGATFFPP